MAASDYTSSMLPLNAFGAQSVASGATVAGLEIDTLGFRFLEVVVNTGVVGASANGTIAVQSSATSGGSFTTITGAEFTVLPGDDTTQLRGFIDLDQMPRYIKLSVTGGTGGASLLAAVAVLSGVNNSTQSIDTGAGGDGEYSFKVMFT